MSPDLYCLIFQRSSMKGPIQSTRCVPLLLVFFEELKISMNLTFAHCQTCLAAHSASASASLLTSPAAASFASPQRPDAALLSFNSPSSSSAAAAVARRFVSKTSGDQLFKHRRRTNALKSVVCQVCGKAFAYNWGLRQHMRTHTGEKPYSCSFCGRCFAEAANLRKHERIHTGERHYVCKLCARSFIHASSLRVHRCAGPRDGH